MSTPGLNQLSGKNRRRHAFVQPPVMAIAPEHMGPHWRAPFEIWHGVCYVLRGMLQVFSLLVEEGRSTFGIMVGIWAKF